MKGLRLVLAAAVGLVAVQWSAPAGRSERTAPGFAHQGGAEAKTASRAAATVRMSKLPLRFEANAGQWDSRVRFRARQGGATLCITDEGMTVGLTDVKPTPRSPGQTPDQERAAREKALKDAKSAAVAIKLVGTKASPPRGEQEIVTKSNFFLGNDPAKWRTNVPNYAQVRAKGWLPGVDVVWHGGASGLEYDLEVAAGVDARKIAFEVEGADSLRVNDDGALEIATGAGTLLQRPPRVVQDGRELHARYQVSGARRVALGLEAYDPAHAALIDPILGYSTYLGGSGDDYSYGIAVDSGGNAYVTGSTSGTFPTTGGCAQTAYGGAAYDAFVAKLDATGSALLYATYLGGGGTDLGYAIAVDSNGNAYVTGWTSGSFPTTSGACQTTLGGGGGDAFVAKLNAAGSALSYSTYLGGSGNDQAQGIAVDSGGNAYIVGSTNGGFPVTLAVAYQKLAGGGFDAFVAKLNTAGSALSYATYLGGSGNDQANGIAVDSGGSAYVVGSTTGGFPTTAGAYQMTSGGGSDVFVVKLSAAGSVLVYSTYLGNNSDDFGMGIAVSTSGNVYITGLTLGGFPTTPGAYQTTAGLGNGDAFVTQLDSAGSTIVYSTYVGGSGGEGGAGIAVDSSGNAYLTGSTNGFFPTTSDAYQATFGGGNADAFVTKLNAAGSALAYSTYLGGGGGEGGKGIAVDASGNAYVTGSTDGNFPTTSGAFQTTFGGMPYDTFVARFSNPELPNGTSCSQPGACASGLCVDGICCDTACTDQCRACDVSGKVGTCTPVTGAPHGARTACNATSPACGFCDGVNTSACTYPGASTACGSTCSAGTETDSSCNGKGDCVVGGAHSCNNLVCTADGTQCKTTCAADTDCATSFTCSGGACVPGATCIDDRTAQPPSGPSQDCSPYKCKSGCPKTCTSVDDCLAPNVCDPSGHCVPPPSSTDSGCSCDTSSRGSPPWGTALLVLAVASALARRRRSA